jgi:hypothetical protein
MMSSSFSGVGTSATQENVTLNPNVIVSVIPQNLSVKVDDTFIINVAISNVTDMFAWQVHLHFDPAILECVRVSAPSDHVLSYAYTVGDALVEYNSTEFKNSLQMIKNDEGWMLIGDCLLGANQTTFNGSGILCQIEFKAISAGSSPLTFSNNYPYSSRETYVLNPNLKDTFPSTIDGGINVSPY